MLSHRKAVEELRASLANFRVRAFPNNAIVPPILLDGWNVKLKQIQDLFGMVRPELLMLRQFDYSRSVRDNAGHVDIQWADLDVALGLAIAALQQSSEHSDCSGVDSRAVATGDPAQSSSIRTAGTFSHCTIVQHSILNQNSSASLTIGSVAAEIAAELKVALETQPISLEDRLAIENQLVMLREEIARHAPRDSVIKGVLLSLRTMFEGGVAQVVGNLVTPKIAAALGIGLVNAAVGGVAP